MQNRDHAVFGSWNARRSTACRSIATAVQFSRRIRASYFRECTAPAMSRPIWRSAAAGSPGGYVMGFTTRIIRFSTGADYKACTRRLSARFGLIPSGWSKAWRCRDPKHSTEGFLDARFSREKHCLPEIAPGQIWHGRDEAKRVVGTNRSRRRLKSL